MTSNRDELAAQIYALVSTDLGSGFRFTYAVQAADALLEAGWRRVGAVDDDTRAPKVHADGWAVFSVAQAIRRARSGEDGNGMLRHPITADDYAEARAALTQDTSQGALRDAQ
jgi:hypothetical protein